MSVLLVLSDPTILIRVSVDVSITVILSRLCITCTERACRCCTIACRDVMISVRKISVTIFIG